MSKWIELKNDADLKKIPQLFNTQLHESASSRYELVPTMEIITSAQKMGWQPAWGAGVGDNPFGFHAVKMEHERYVTSEGDKIQLIVMNSHDRTRRHSLDMGAYRFFCSNGLRIAIMELMSFKQRHIGFETSELMEALDVAMQSAEQVGSVIKKLEQRIMSPTEIQEFAYKSLMLRLTEEQVQTVNLDEFIFSKRSADLGNSLWKGFNVAQEKLIKGDFQYDILNKDEKTVTRKGRAIDGFKTDLELNQEVFMLCGDYVEL